MCDELTQSMCVTVKSTTGQLEVAHKHSTVLSQALHDERCLRAEAERQHVAEMEKLKQAHVQSHHNQCHA